MTLKWRSKSLSIILSLILSSHSGLAATSPKVYKQLQKSKKNVVTLRSQIQNLEKKLNKSNQKYLMTVQTRQKIDLEIFELERSLNQSTARLMEKKDKLDREYKRLLLNALDEVSAQDLMEKKVLLMRIKKSKTAINNQLSNDKKLKDELVKLKYQFQETIKVENELYSLLANLEREKQGEVQAYISENEKLETLKEEYKKEQELLSKERAKKAKKRKRLARTRKKIKSRGGVVTINDTFLAPFSEFVSRDYKKKKGITYKVKDVKEVKAGKGGKVAYVGTLANYGNIVMIDHGGDVRSIYLGDFTSLVKKDDEVKLSQVIGRTRRSLKKGAMAEVYFEVRKKNKVQNTIKLVKNSSPQQV